MGLVLLSTRKMLSTRKCETLLRRLELPHSISCMSTCKVHLQDMGIYGRSHGVEDVPLLVLSIYTLYHVYIAILKLYW